MSDYVLDSSAVLAFVKQEPGGEYVAGIIGDAVIGATNFAEVVGHLWEAGLTPADIDALIESLCLQVVPIDRDLAIDIGALRPLTKSAGLSLGDRSCLALARKLALPVVTADRAWSRVELPGVVIRQLRS